MGIIFMAIKKKPTVLGAIIYGASAGITIYLILWLIELIKYGHAFIWGY